MALKADRNELDVDISYFYNAGTAERGGVVALASAGSGAAMVDAFASLNVVDLKVQDDLTLTDDLIVNGDIDLEGSIDVNGTSNLDVVDIDGAVDMA